MSERAFFRGHSVSKILTFDHVIEGVELNVNSIQVKESTNADLLALTVRV